MDRDYFRYEPAHSYGRSRKKKTNLFGWSVAILLLTGFALAAWLGSFYIFWQPERPQSYKILKKLHKIEPTKRFELTAAPHGEFLTSKQLYDRYIAMSPTELANVNAELTRNYIRNFQQVRGLVTYVVGRFNIMEAHSSRQMTFSFRHGAHQRGRPRRAVDGTRLSCRSTIAAVDETNADDGPGDQA